MKDDKKNKKTKGFLRNSAINVAQDIVQAGNPLNPGGHIVGSILDSALLEMGDRRMSRKLYQDTKYDKKASEFLDELYFEKTAGVGTVFSMIGKNVNKLGNGVKRYGNLLAGGNVNALTKNVASNKKVFFDSGQRLGTFNNQIKSGKFATKSQDAIQNAKNNMFNSMMNNKNAYQASKDALNMEQNKVLAARVGTGVGVGALGMSALDNVTNRMADNNRTASEYLDELYFEKTAGVVDSAKKIGGKIISSKPVQAVITHPTVARGAELLTGSKAKQLAKEIQDLERQKENLTLFQKMRGKKRKLNELQNQKYKLFDIEAREVENARKTAAIGGGLGIAGVNLARTHIRDKKQAREVSNEPAGF